MTLPMRMVLAAASLTGMVLSATAGSDRLGWSVAVGQDIEPQAVIGSTAARFVFPAEAVDQLSWPPAIPHAYPGMPVRAWRVDWERGMYSERFGIDPHAIATIARWRPGTARTWTLAELLATVRPVVLTFCISCGTPAATTREDAAVRVRMVGRQVVVTVRGADAVRRIFPTMPDSVTLTRRVPGTDEQRLRVAVERRDPEVGRDE